MHELLGLSLTANKVVWTLVDPVDGTIVAQDVVEVDSAENVANAAANSVRAIVSQTERHIQAIRIAWSRGAAGSAVKLTSQLRSSGFSDVDLITEDEARGSRNRTARYIDPPLELAYGAARTVTAEDQDRPLRRMTSRLPARRVAVAVALGVALMAVSTAAAGHLLEGRTPSRAADHAPAPVSSAPPTSDAPFVVVPASALPPPPAPEVAVAPPVVVALPWAEEAAPTVIDQPEVETAPQIAVLTDPTPTPMQVATVAGEPHLAAEAPSAGPTIIPGTDHLPVAATAPGPAPAATLAGQPHLPPETLSTRPLPGPVAPTSVVGVTGPPANPPNPPNPLGIFAALP
jgi:hypothetical protein